LVLYLTFLTTCYWPNVACREEQHTTQSRQSGLVGTDNRQLLIAAEFSFNLVFLHYKHLQVKTFSALRPSNGQQSLRYSSLEPSACKLPVTRCTKTMTTKT
jgi:hypothetical protein